MIPSFSFEEKLLIGFGAIDLATLIGAALWRVKTTPLARNPPEAGAGTLVKNTLIVLFGLVFWSLFLIPLLDRLDVPDFWFSLGRKASIAVPWLLVLILFRGYKRSRRQIGLGRGDDEMLNVITAVSAFPILALGFFLGHGLMPGVWGLFLLKSGTIAVTEEICFRGLWQNAAESVFGPRWGLWLGAGFYMLAHFPMVLIQGQRLADPIVLFYLFYYAVSGLLFGWLFRRTRSVSGIALLHLSAELAFALMGG